MNEPRPVEPKGPGDNDAQSPATPPPAESASARPDAALDEPDTEAADATRAAPSTGGLPPAEENAATAGAVGSGAEAAPEAGADGPAAPAPAPAPVLLIARAAHEEPAPGSAPVQIPDPATPTREAAPAATSVAGAPATEAAPEAGVGALAVPPSVEAAPVAGTGQNEPVHGPAPAESPARAEEAARPPEPLRAAFAAGPMPPAPDLPAPPLLEPAPTAASVAGASVMQAAPGDGGDRLAERLPAETPAAPIAGARDDEAARAPADAAPEASPATAVPAPPALEAMPPPTSDAAEAAVDEAALGGAHPRPDAAVAPEIPPSDLAQQPMEAPDGWAEPAISSAAPERGQHLAPRPAADAASAAFAVAAAAIRPSPSQAPPAVAADWSSRRLSVDAARELLSRGSPHLHRARPYLRLALRGAAALAAAYAAIVLSLIVLYRWVNPPISTLMLGQSIAGTSIERTWVPLERVSPHLVNAVVLSEDGRFCTHHGVDLGALRVAMGSDRGGSTITMQVVKNLFLWPSRSYVRKAIEIGLAYLVDAVWPKRRILEIYLNIVEWGDGVFGAEAAAREHFGKPARRLAPREAALLAVALPNPIERSPGHPSAGMSRLATRLQVRVAMSRLSLACVRMQRPPPRSAAKAAPRPRPKPEPKPELKPEAKWEDLFPAPN